MADVNMTIDMVNASQAGMKAIGAGLAVGLTGVGTGVLVALPVTVVFVPAPPVKVTL